MPLTCSQEEWVSSIEWAERKEAAKFVAAVHRGLDVKGREEWCDGEAVRQGRREVKLSVGGSKVVIEKEPGYQLFEGAQLGRRGRCGAFRGRQRQRMLEFVSGIQVKKLPLFVTLTYPGWWPGQESWQSWKADLHRFWMKLSRRHPTAAFVWKLEPQQRGAPHFHLLVYGVPFLAHEWLAKAWFECVGSDDERHLQAGTQVRAAESVNGVQAYCSKAYMGKEVKQPANWEHVGRWWGCYGRARMPLAPVFRCFLTVGQAFVLRRLLRRRLRAPGRVAPKDVSRRMGRMVLFTQGILDWGRALDWVCGVDVVPRHIGVALADTPF